MFSDLQDLRSVALWLPIELRERLRWRRGAVPGDAAVFYGFDRLPPPQTMSGGLVKVLDLQPTFPNRPHDSNILYLVSSALPRLVGRMVSRAKAAGAKVVLNQNGVAYPGWYGAGWESVNRPMRDVLHRADYVFYQSRFCQETADRFLGRRSGPAEILYNPVDTVAFSPADRTPDRGSLVLLLAGSHQSFYRVQTAVDCLKRVRSRLSTARLRIAGRFVWRPSETEALTELRTYIAAQGMQASVDLSGAYSPAEAATLLRGAHILLHTKYNDPCPRLVVEALACGVPVAYSATGGVPELVGEEAGLGVAGPLDYERDHPPSAALLADAVVAIAERLTEFSRAARSLAVARFDARPWVMRHSEVFTSLLQSSR